MIKTYYKTIIDNLGKYERKWRGIGLILFFLVDEIGIGFEIAAVALIAN